VLWEAATGTCAFGDPRDGDHEFPVLHRRADSVRCLRPRLPAALREAIDACLEPDPADRPTVAEVLAVSR
jgi:hypothetical protein